MKHILKHIPNALTIGNLLCGMVAVVLALQGNYIGVFFAVVLGALFDFLDGMAARLLKAYSPLGADLDSLADMVTFGVAPSMALFTLFSCFDPIVAYCSFFLAVGAALRLAKFNVDTEQTSEFRGLPTPAMALFFVSFVSCAPWLIGCFSGGVVVCILLFLIAAFVALMTCRLPMFSLKFKSWGLRENLVRYLFLLLALGVWVFCGFLLLPVVVVSIYILYSLSVRYANRAR